jgi:hypothetical protein
VQDPTGVICKFGNLRNRYGSKLFCNQWLIFYEFRSMTEVRRIKFSYAYWEVTTMVSLQEEFCPVPVCTDVRPDKWRIGR